MASAREGLHDVHEWSAARVAAALADGAVTSSEIVAALVERIASIDAPGSEIELRAVLAVASDAADAARRADDERAGGRARSALHGVPVVIKDNVEAVGLPGTAGATSLAGRPVVGDAPLVRRLRDAGMVVLAATNLSEWANIRSPRSTSGWSAVGGLTVNPYRLDRSAGGSSSGSGAAVAARLSPLSVGTETDGSITCPASLNGLAGLKPAVGAIPKDGVVPISASQDSPGPMARSVEDVALLYEVLAGLEGVVDRVAAGVDGLRIGAATTLLTSHPGTDALFAEAIVHLERAGATVSDVAYAATPNEVDEDELTVLLCELADDLSAYLAARPGDGPRSLDDVLAHETAHADVELRFFGHEFFERAVDTGGRASEDYAGARARNVEWATASCLEPALARVDLVVAPSYGPAWKNDLTLGGHPAAYSGICSAPSIAGWPIATVPMGLVDGLPVGLSLVGRPGTEAILLAAAAGLERTAGLLGDDALAPTYAAAQRA
jgi:amidase